MTLKQREKQMLEQEEGTEVLSRRDKKPPRTHAETLARGEKRILSWDSRKKGRQFVTGKWPEGGRRFQEIFKMDGNIKWHTGTSRSF